MDIAILLYDGFTALDAVGPYEVLVRVPGASVTFVAPEAGPVRTDTRRLEVTADAAMADLASPDVVLVPGGPGQEDHMEDEAVLAWLRAAGATARWTTSVCTGSLLLAAAGLLEGKRATSHWLAVERLADFGAVPTSERVVVEGSTITAAGVSAGIDMALHLVAAEAGDAVAQAIQLGIEYDPQPPFAAGSPHTAPPEITDFMRANSRHLMARS